MQTSNFYSSKNKAPKYIMKGGLGKSQSSSIDTPRLTATLQCGRGRGRGVRRPAVAPVVPVAGPCVAVPVHVCDEHDDDSEKENEPYEIEGAEVEDEEEEGDFEWKCHLLDIIQQYPEVYDLAHPHTRTKTSVTKLGTKLLKAWMPLVISLLCINFHINLKHFRHGKCFI